MNQSGRRSLALPAWLDAATVAILGTVLMVAVGIGAMVQTSLVGLRAELKEARQELSANIGKVRDDLSAEIENVRNELRAEIGQLDDRLRAVGIDVAAIRASVVGLDARVRVIELRGDGTDGTKGTGSRET